MDQNDRDALSQLRSEMSATNVKIVNITSELSEIKSMVRELSNPRPTNWSGIMSVSVTIILAICAGVWLFLNLRLAPLEKDIAKVSEAQNAQKERTDREFVWYWDSQHSYREFTDKELNRLFDRVFGVDAPKFVDKPKQ